MPFGLFLILLLAVIADAALTIWLAVQFGATASALAVAVTLMASLLWRQVAARNP